jgi:hypothetical protein
MNKLVYLIFIIIIVFFIIYYLNKLLRNNYLKYDFEIKNYYENTYPNNFLYRINKNYKKIENINQLIKYQKKYIKQYIFNDKESFLKYYNDFDLKYYKNKYFKNSDKSDYEIMLYYHNTGKNLRHTKNNKLKIVIYTPIFDINSGGIVVMHNLAKLINELHNPNIYAKLFIINNFRYKNIFCNDFATIEDIDDNTFVIYPEIISGNPLNAKKCMRWILLDLGIDMPLNHYEKWNKKDLIYFWETKDTTNKYFKQLSCPWFNNIFYNKGLKFEERQKTCYLIKKGKLIHKKINYYHKNNDSICLDNITSLKEKCEIFNTCKYFYCYDPNSMYVIYAILCGCIPIIYPIEGMTKEDYMKNRIYNCGNNLIDIGFSYGNSESEINNSIQKNKKSSVLVNKIFDFYKNQVNIFCDEIYNNIFNNIELDNTIKNYYDLKYIMNFYYYKEFNPELKNMSNNQLINYFYNNSKKEVKIFNEEIFYYLYPDFDYLLYGTINKDLIGYSKFKLQQHYHLYGRNEQRIHSKKKFYECYPNFVLDNNNIPEHELLSNYHNNINLLEKNNNITFFDVPQLNFRKLNIYNFDNLYHITQIFDEYKSNRLNNNINNNESYFNFDIHTDYLFFLHQSINNKKILIKCPFTNNIISSDIYFINNIYIDDFKIPYCICNYVFDDYIILGIGLGSGKGAMETRILYIYSIVHNKIYYNWPEYDKSLFIKKNVPIIIDFYNKIKLENYIEKNNINISKIISIYGFMANLGHYLFNDITGFYLLENYDMISKIDTIYFGNNDNYFIKEYIKNRYPNIEIIEKNDDYINFMDGYIGKGICFKYNHFFISNKCINFLRNNLLNNIKLIKDYTKNNEIYYIKDNYYPIINIVLRAGNSNVKNIMVDSIGTISRFINKMSIKYPKSYFFLDGFCGSPYLNNTLLGENEGFNSNDLINEYKNMAGEIINHLDNKNCKSLINMYSYELIDYIDICNYSILQVGSACTISGWICNKDGFQFGRKDVKIYESMDKCIKEEKIKIIYYMDSNKIKFSNDYYTISEDTIIENIPNF